MKTLCGCETWSLILSEEHRLRVSKNRVLRRIFGPKRQKVAGCFRKLRNEEIQNVYFSSYIRMTNAWKMKLMGYVA
jgi:hypothetical protein